MKVILERIDKEFLFEVTNQNGHKILLDNKSKETGEVKGVSPMELLLMGIAGCSSIDVVAILKKQKINPTLLKMKVEGFRHAGAVPSLFYQIDLVIFPEMTLTGFSMNTQKIVEGIQGSKTINFFKNLALKKKINIIFGMVLKRAVEIRK